MEAGGLPSPTILVGNASWVNPLHAVAFPGVGGDGGYIRPRPRLRALAAQRAAPTPLAIASATIDAENLASRLGAGSVSHSTGTFDMRLMGGMRKTQPWT